MNYSVDILLVEDDPHDAELTLRTLGKSHAGRSVQVVRDGEEALDYIFCRAAYSGRDILSQPRLILLDLKLPRLNGIEVLKQIKADQRTRAVPVVIMTSSGERRDVVDSYSFGVNSYVVKPVDYEGFSKAVQELGLYWMVVNHPPLAV